MSRILTFKSFESANRYKSTRYVRKELNNFYKAYGIELFYARKYEMSTVFLIEVTISLLSCAGLKNDTEDVILLVLYAISLLCRDEKRRVSKLFDLILYKDIPPEVRTSVINYVSNIRDVMQDIGLVDDQLFVSILKKVDVLSSLVSALSSMIVDELVNCSSFGRTYVSFKDEIGNDGYELFISRVTKRMTIQAGSTNRFQNKDNMRPLLINNDFKSPSIRSKNYNIK